MSLNKTNESSGTLKDSSQMIKNQYWSLSILYSTFMNERIPMPAADKWENNEMCSTCRGVQITKIRFNCKTIARIWRFGNLFFSGHWKWENVKIKISWEVAAEQEINEKKSICGWPLCTCRCSFSTKTMTSLLFRKPNWIVFHKRVRSHVLPTKAFQIQIVFRIISLSKSKPMCNKMIVDRWDLHTNFYLSSTTGRFVECFEHCSAIFFITLTVQRYLVSTFKSADNFQYCFFALSFTFARVNLPSTIVYSKFNVTVEWIRWELQAYT